MAIEMLLVLRTGLDILKDAETLINASKAMCDTSATKNIQINNSLPHTHFNKHHVDVAEKPTREHDET
jgi:hypothetical protein